MPKKYKVYFAKYLTVELEAETDEEVEDKAKSLITAYLAQHGDPEWRLEEIETAE